MPMSFASEGEFADLPKIDICPESGKSTPDITFARVDFPEPFPPIIACISPSNALKETRSSAFVGPKVFVTSTKSTAILDKINFHFSLAILKPSSKLSCWVYKFNCLSDERQDHTLQDQQA